MVRLKKTVVRVCVIFIILIPISTFAHFLVFPQQTRSILIDYSSFKNDGDIYFNPSTPPNKIDSLKLLIKLASIRIDSIWGEKTSSPKFIYCDNEEDFKKYCANPSAPAVTYTKLYPIIVLSTNALNLDIIAHEASHAEFYQRIGFNKFNNEIPSWFRHGLAMQSDYRSYYSEDTLKIKSNNFKNLPDVKSFKSDGQFYAGSLQQVMLNYMTAKYEVKNWYTKDKLAKLIKDINSGKTFEEAYE